MKKKGFTLIELLIVVAILAILSVAVILTLNPAQMLKQARDSQRLSDMSTLKSAIALYLQDVLSQSIGNATVCYGSSPQTPSTAGCGGRLNASTELTVGTTTLATAASTTGGGWIPINFAAITSGSPLGALPVDPINNATYFYAYATTASPSYQYKIASHMESTKYAASGTSDVESTDGGINAAAYEIGTNLSL